MKNKFDPSFLTDEIVSRFREYEKSKCLICHGEIEYSRSDTAITLCQHVVH